MTADGRSGNALPEGSAVERRKVGGPLPRRVVLLLGSPRSGTSWLAKILDTHPEVWYAHEPLSKSSRERVRALTSLLRKGTPSEDERRELLAEVCWADSQCMLVPFFPKAWRWTPTCLLSTARLAVSISGWGRALFGNWFTPPAHARFDLVVKEVDWQGFVSRVVRGLEPAALIVIVRHPCAVVASRLQGLRLGIMDSYRAGWWERHCAVCKGLGYSEAVFQKMQDYEFFALTWLLQNVEYQATAQHHPHAVTVVYEDLCRDPRARSAELFAALGWEPSATTDDFIERSTRPGTARQVKRWLRGRRSYYDIFKDPTKTCGAWRDLLTKDQQERTLAIARPLLDKGWWKEGPAASDGIGCAPDTPSLNETAASNDLGHGSVLTPTERTISRS
jgi:hypothetical protein